MALGEHYEYPDPHVDQKRHDTDERRRGLGLRVTHRVLTPEEVEERLAEDGGVYVKIPGAGDRWVPAEEWRLWQR